MIVITINLLSKLLVLTFCSSNYFSSSSHSDKLSSWRGQSLTYYWKPADAGWTHLGCCRHSSCSFWIWTVQLQRSCCWQRRLLLLCNYCKSLEVRCSVAERWNIFGLFSSSDHYNQAEFSDRESQRCQKCITAWPFHLKPPRKRRNSVKRCSPNSSMRSVCRQAPAAQITSFLSILSVQHTFTLFSLYTQT